MTKKSNPKRRSITELQQDQAQTQPQTHHSVRPQPIAHTETERLLHELQVYQVELQLQNEELMQSRARVEAGLRQYTDLYDFAPVGYLTLSFDGTINQINLTGATLLGQARATLVNRRFEHFVASEFRAVFNTFLRQVCECHDKLSCEVEFVKPGHEHLWVQVEGRAADDAQHCHVVIMDISARVRAEQALRDSEQHFRMIADSAPLKIWLSGPTGENLYHNQRLLDFTGTTHAEQMMGSWSHLVHPDDRADFIQACEDDLRTPKPFEHQYRLRRVDGQYRWVVDTGGPRFADDGTFLGYIGSIMDVTERIEAAHLLKKGVNQRTNELAQLLVLSQAVAFAGDPHLLLQLILEKLRLVIPYTRASVYMKAGIGNSDDLRVVSDSKAVGSESMAPATLSIPWPAYEHLRDVLDHKQTVIIDDVTSGSAHAVAFRRWRADQIPSGSLPQHNAGSWTGTALVVAGEAIGMLALMNDTAQANTEKDIELLKIFANYAATAINNDLLKDSVTKAATLAERTRIARELHDSVSQALFGIVLGARTSQQLLVRNHLTSLPETLSYTTLLAEEALADMRSLILELHPDTMEKEGLVVALQKQAATIFARNHLKIELDLSAEPHLTLGVKEAIYRITSEALQNIIKHAEASRVTLALATHGEETPPMVHVRISDNGRGFDPDEIFLGISACTPCANVARSSTAPYTFTARRGRAPRFY